jgi:hypothetical protein
MRRWPWQEVISTSTPERDNLAYVIRTSLHLGARVWSVRIERNYVVVTLRRRGGTLTLPYDASATSQLIAQRLVAWRGDLFGEHGTQAIVSWYRDFMLALRQYPECEELQLSISASGHFVRWRKDELFGAVEFYIADGAEIARLVACDVASVWTAL